MTRQALVVAAWEFHRFFKWKDQAIAFGLFVVLTAVVVGAGLIAAARGRTQTVALAGVALAAPEGGRLRFVPAAGDEAAREEALRRGTVQGVLSRRSGGGFELRVAKDPRYRAELEALLGEAVRRERLTEFGIPAEKLEQVLAPVDLDVRFLDPGKQRRGTAEKVAAGVFVGVFLIGAFTSMAYLFAGITGEKQLRVTESVVSAVSPQTWIDGKVLGITGATLASLVTLGVGGALTTGGAMFAWSFSLPAAAVRPAVVAVMALFTVLGLLLWSAFFAAVAATIDDPNTSSRSALLLLPVVPVILCLAVVRDPDAPWSVFLALCPLTAAPALPARLVLSDPGLVEIAAAAALLTATIWLIRRLAGRVFEVGMLLYGKEPSLAEVARWARG